jgi:hypothetical protein
LRLKNNAKINDTKSWFFEKIRMIDFSYNNQKKEGKVLNLKKLDMKKGLLPQIPIKFRGR